MACHGASSALQCGRGDRAPPRKSPYASFPGLPRKATLACIAHAAEGRAPHARNDGTTPTLPPFGHRFIVNACGGNEMSRRTYGLATRARRPRPSEKTALRAVSGLSRKALSPWLAPRGGAGSASPQRGHWLRGGYSPLGSRPLARASGGNGMPWRSFSLAMRTHRVRPSEKTSLGAIPWFAPVRLSSHRLTTPRRGGLRTPVATAQRQRCLPLATGSSSTHVVEMKCLGVRTALQRGRGDRAPPRKLPFAPSPGFPARPSHLGSPPAEGRAPHARNEGIGFEEDIPLRVPASRACIRWKWNALALV
jgi:hypothetical protein